MTRIDLAHLVLRTFALWFGMNGVVASVSALDSQARLESLPFALTVAGMYLVLGVVLWVFVPALARLIFGGRDDATFHVVPESVPQLAGYLVGFLMLAQAVPRAASLIGIQIFRNRQSASVMSGSSDWMFRSWDERFIDSGVTLVAQIIVGLLLLANSHRLSAWTRIDADGIDAGDVDADADVGR